MDINFELYKIFYFAAKSKNFSDAAQKLFISQSAVSQAVKNLEEKTGSLLFVRKPRCTALTQEGKLLFSHIEQAYNFIKTAENKLLEIHNLESGEIRIGVSDTICKYFLLPHLETFTEMYPKIKIQVVNRTSTQILNILKNGLIDFGIATLPVKDNTMEVEEFETVEDIFVASPKYSQLHGREVKLEELAKYPLLMLPRNSTTRLNLDNCLSEYGVSITPEIELESMDLLIEFAKIGLGISHVLKKSAEESITKGEIFHVQTTEKLPLRKLGIISVKNVPLSPASRKFISHLTKH
ncbi:MAG: LysR family transcriptional regulator [Bacillota bacterium]|nr:LysR family transcriptional regulator [Bacillota bacterium]